jgi:hypothetical protein
MTGKDGSAPAGLTRRVIVEEAIDAMRLLSREEQDALLKWAARRLFELRGPAAAAGFCLLLASQDGAGHERA